MHTKEGVEVAVKIWEQFVKNRRERRNKGEEKDREMRWGWGDVEE
jgi:hypothetical protein